MFQLIQKFLTAAIFLLLWQAFICTETQAQDLEPRRWSHLPIGLNVLGVATAWTDGDISFDPVLRIEDGTFDMWVAGVGYARSFELFGKSARFDFNAPYARGRWEGLVNGVDTVVRRQGFMDPYMRFSINLYGAPPLRGKEFVQYRREHPVETTIGAAIGVMLPLGDYNDQKLINLGNNRFTIRPQLGVLHQRYKWQFELTGSVFLSQANDEFWKGNELKRDPLWFSQGHIIYTFKPGLWASASVGYAYGGQSKINGVSKDDDQRTLYTALSLGVPINMQQGLKFSYFTSETHTSTGSSYNALIAAWSINWGM
jgi:hypothetical protein